MPNSSPPSAGELARAFLTFLCLAVIALNVNPFRGEIAGPFDLLLSQTGWGGSIPMAQVRDAERSDVLDYYLPRWIYARNEIRDGRVPLWDPLPAGGEPAILNLASGELTPAFVLFLLARTPAWGVLAAVLFNLAFGATGLYAFVRRHGNRLPGIFAGVTVMLCGFTAAWLYWPHVSTVIWIGWLLWGVDRAMQLQCRYATAGIVLPMAGLMLGGFPFVTFLGLCASGLYVLCAWVVDSSTRDRRVAVRLCVAAVLAFGLAAPGLLGLAEWLRDFDLSERTFGSILTFRDANLLSPWQAFSRRDVEVSMFAGSAALLLTPIGLAVNVWVMCAKQGRPILPHVFEVVLLIVSAALVFELVPRGLFSWAPVLSSNRWTRAISILDLSLALNAARVLQTMATHWARRPFLLVASCLLLVQAVELTRYFRLYNGASPAQTYYPALPLVEHVKANSLRFQSTVADQSFLVSGTLGAYGVAEWLGHGFRTEELKKTFQDVADSPLSTATASRIGSGALHLDSPTLSALGVRYALGDDAMTMSVVGVPALARGENRVALPPMPGSILVQRVDIVLPTVVHGVRFSLATYGRAGQGGKLDVTLSKEGVAGPLARWQVAASTIMDNAQRGFMLPAALTLLPGAYSLRLSYEGAGPDDQLTVWSFPGRWAGCSAGVEGQAPSGCMDFGMMVERHDLGDFKEVASSGGIHLLENKDVPSGAYLIKSLGDRPRATSSDPVRLVSGGFTGFALHYSGVGRGLVVVPMSLRSGWVVTRNTLPVSALHFMGIMPAVPVDGPSDIVFRYRPLALLFGVPAALVALIALIWMTCHEAVLPRRHSALR